MPDEQNNGLPPRLRERLDAAMPGEGLDASAGDAPSRHWSLSDIDQLILEVQDNIVTVPDPEDILYAPALDAVVPLPEPVIPRQKPEPEPEPEPAPKPPPQPEPEPKPAPPPEPPTQTIPKVQQQLPEPDLPSGGEIQPDEVTEPAPQPDPRRFDLFQKQPETKPVWSGQIEKPGVVLRRVDMQMTSDLSPVPKVVPAEEFRVQEPAPEQVQEDIPEGQQRFADFDETPAETLNEDDLNARLEKSRAKRTAQFQALRNLSSRMEESGETGTQPSLPPSPPPPEEQNGAPEYRAPAQRDAVYKLLQKTRSRRASSAMILIGLTLFAAVLQVISMVSSSLPGNAPGFLAPMALFLVSSLLVCGGDLINGAAALFRRKPNANTGLFFAALLVVAQTVLQFVFIEEMGVADDPHRVPASTPLFLFAAALLAAARWQQARQRCDNFRFCAYTAADTLYAIQPLDAREAAKTARQNALPGRSDTVLPVPVQFPAGFLQQSLKEDAMDQTSKVMLPLAAGLAVFAGLFAALQQGTAIAIVTAAALAVCVCVPCASLLILAGLVRSFTKTSRENGVAILNTDAAEEYAKAGAFVLDSMDLYLPAKGRMHGWREYWQVRTDEVLLYAAGIAIAAGGPLQAVFEGVVEGDYSVLPPVRELTYEDRMGLSCWIHNQKVFFGNRSLLENHGITVALSEKDERTYEHDGRRILYLAVEKRLTAFFVVSYCPDEDMAPAFRLLEAEGSQALLCNSDPCVSDEFLCSTFGLREGSLSLLRAAPSAALRKQMRTPRASLNAAVYHSGNARAFMRALTACVSLQGGIKRLRLFQAVGCFMSFLLLLIFVLTGQLHYANSLIFVALEVVWAVVMQTAVRN